MNWRASVESHATPADNSWRKPAKSFQLERKTPGWRIFKFLLGTGLLVFSVIALIWIFRFINRHTVGIVITQTPPTPSLVLPGNPYVEEDSSLFTGFKGFDSFTDQSVTPPIVCSLDEIHKYPTTKSLVIYLNLLVTLNTQGDNLDIIAYNRQTTSWEDKPKGYSLLGYLDELAKVQKELYSRRIKRNVLLLLDINHQENNIRMGSMGVLYDKILESHLHKIPNTVTILSSAVSDGSPRSADLEAGGHSLFAYYATQGLAGKSDINQDLNISPLELFNYLRTNIDQWIRNNRTEKYVSPPLLYCYLSSKSNIKDSTNTAAVSKLPLLNFSILRIKQGAYQLPVTNKVAIKDSDIDYLMEQWDNYKAIESKYNLRENAPLYSRLYTHEIQIAEKKWLEGSLDDKIKEEFNSKLASLNNRIKFNFDKEAGLLQIDDRFIHESLLKFIPEYQPQNAPQPSAVEQELPTPLEVSKSHFELKSANIPFPKNFQIDEKEFTLIYERRVTADKLFGSSFYCFDWIKNNFQQAEIRRRKLEDMLFLGSKWNTLVSSNTSIKDLYNNEQNQANSSYQDCELLVKSLTAGRIFSNQALDELTYVINWISQQHKYSEKQIDQDSPQNRLIKYLLTISGNNESRNTVLDKITDNTTKQLANLYSGSSASENIEIKTFLLCGELIKLQSLLNQTITDPNEQKQRITDINQTVTKLTADLSQIKEQITKSVNQLEEISSQPQNIQREQILAYLEIPFLELNSRKKLLKNFRAIEKTLHQKNTEKPSTQITADTLTENTTPSIVPSLLLKHGHWQLLWEIKLISLTSISDSSELLRSWGNIDSNNPDQKELLKMYQLSRKIQQFWNTQRAQYLDQIRTTADAFAEKKLLLKKLDNLARVFPFIDCMLLEDQENNNPLTQLKTIELCQRLLYGADRCLADYWTGTKNFSGKDEWYISAYNRFLTAGKNLAVINGIDLQIKEFNSLLTDLENNRQNYELFKLNVNNDNVGKLQINLDKSPNCKIRYQSPANSCRNV